MPEGLGGDHGRRGDGAAGRGATTPVAKYILTNVEDEATSARPEAKPSTDTWPSRRRHEDQAVHPGPRVGSEPGGALNHKVRVTGKVEPGDRALGRGQHASQRIAAKPDQTPRTGMIATGMDKGWSTLTVSSLTMVSATCPAPTV